MSEEPFGATLEAARRGDGRAFEHLYESLSRRVHAFVAARGASDPEGTVNDVFVKVFTNVCDFEGNEAQFQGWVFTIARNKLIDEARRAKRRVQESRLDDVQDAASTGDVEIEAIGGLGDEWVIAQLDALTPEQRDVVVLRIVSDLTIEAIAVALDKPAGAVKAMQRRAFRTLARHLDGQAVPR